MARQTVAIDRGVAANQSTRSQKRNSLHTLKDLASLSTAEGKTKGQAGRRGIFRPRSFAQLSSSRP